MSNRTDRISRNLRLLGRSIRDPHARTTAARRYQYYLAGLVTQGLTTTRDGMTFLLDTRDRTIGRDTFVSGCYELDVMSAAMDVLADKCGPDWLKGRTFVDVGANIGTTTVPAVIRFGAARAISIEPDPENARMLRANLELNDIRERVRVVEAAASDVNGVVRLERCAKNHGDHRVTTTGGVAVAAVRLDDVVKHDERQDVAVLWMDTQGHEPLVLEGTSLRCPTISEFWPPVLRANGRLQRFLELVSERYQVAVDVRTGLEVPTDDLEAIAQRTEAEAESQLTDLVLLP